MKTQAGLKTRGHSWPNELHAERVGSPLKSKSRRKMQNNHKTYQRPSPNLRPLKSHPFTSPAHNPPRSALQSCTPPLQASTDVSSPMAPGTRHRVCCGVTQERLSQLPATVPTSIGLHNPRRPRSGAWWLHPQAVQGWLPKPPSQPA